MSEPMIRLENVSKSYDGGKTYAVRHINLSIEKGDFVAWTFRLRQINHADDALRSLQTDGREHLLQRQICE